MTKAKASKMFFLLLIGLVISTFLFPINSHAASKTHLKKMSITLTYGSTYQQKLISSSGKTIAATSVTWKSKNTSVAKINKKGKVSTVKSGTTKITAKYKGKTYTFSVKVKNPTLRTTKKTLKCGDSYTQKLYNVNKKVISTSNIKFSSSNTKVATVSSKGIIKAKKSGTTTISLKYKGKTFKSTITVKSRLSLSSTKMVFDKFKTKSVTISTDAKVKSVSYDIQGSENINCTWGKWNGNDIKLKIKPLAVGKTKIAITYEGKGSSYDRKYITVYVNEPVKSISLMESAIMLKGSEKVLTATIDPFNATNKNVTWKSSNKSVATVDKNGKVKAIGEGECIITVTSYNGLQARCKIKVMAPNCEMRSLLPNIYSYNVGGTKVYVENCNISYEQYWSEEKVNIKIELLCEKIYDKKGKDGISSCSISYRIYNADTDIVVSSGSFYKTDIKERDRFTVSTSLTGVPSGNYYVVLSDRN